MQKNAGELLTTGCASGAYSVVHKVLEKSICIKYFKDKQSLAAIKELAIGNYLSHECIVSFTCLDYEEEKWKMYMRLYTGDISNKKALYEYGYIGIISVIRDVIEGLSYMHSKRVIHGDIKPQNILYYTQIQKNSQDEQLRAVICDFNLCVFNPTETNSSCIQSPLYRAPEVNINKKMSIYSYNVDIWSLGAVMYELLTNEYIIPLAKCTYNSMQNARIIYNASSPCDLTNKELLNYWRERLNSAILVECEERNALVGIFSHIISSCLHPNHSERSNIFQLVEMINPLLKLLKMREIEIINPIVPICAIPNSIQTIHALYLPHLCLEFKDDILKEYAAFLRISIDLSESAKHLALLLDIKYYKSAFVKKIPNTADSMIILCSAICVSCVVHNIVTPAQIRNCYDGDYLYKKIVELLSVINYQVIE